MRDLLILTIYLIVTVAQRLRPGGVRALAAESVSLKHQLIVSNRVRLRAPNLTTIDRFLIGQFERESLGPKARVLNGLLSTPI